MGQTTLRALGGIAKASDLFIEIDSVPMHLAAAVGTPVIALFGPSLDSNWHPWTEKYILLKKNEGCNPYAPNGCITTKRCICLEKIKINDILEALSSLLNFPSI